MACWREAQLAWVLTIAVLFFLPANAFAPAQGPFWQVAHKRGGAWPGADVGAAEQRNALPGSRWIAPKQQRSARLQRDLMDDSSRFYPAERNVLPTQKREYRAGGPTAPRSAGGPRGSGPGVRQMFRTGVQAIFKRRATFVLYLLVLTSGLFPLPSRATPSGRAVQLQEHVAAPPTNGEVSLRRGIGHPRVAFVTPQDPVKTISEPAFKKDPTLDEMNGPFQGFFTSTGLASKFDRMRQDSTEAIYYYMFEILTSNPILKMMWILGTSGILVAIGGFTLYKVGGGERSLSEAMFVSYALLSNTPGASAVDEERTASRFVVNVIAVVGLFSFAVVLGIVTSSIEAALDSALEGSHKVVERDHVLMLNWGPSTVPMLHQIEEAMNEGQIPRSPVAILAKRDKKMMDEEIRQSLEKTRLNIETRSGDPSQAKDLQKVSAGWANYVLLSADETSSDPEEDLIVQAASLRALQKDRRPRMTVGNDRSQIHIVVTNCDEAPEPQALVGATYCPKNTFEQRLITAAASQPGLVEVFNQIFVQGQGAEMYLKEFKRYPWLHGKSFSELGAYFPDSVVMGWIAPTSTERLRLNPGRDVVPPSNAKMIVLSQTSKIRVVRSPILAEQTGWTPVNRDIAKGVERRKQHVLFIKSDTGTKALEFLDEILPDGSSITVLAENPIKMRTKPGVAFRYIEGYPLSYADIESAGLSKFDTVVIEGNPQLSHELRDAQVLATARFVAMARQDVRDSDSELRLVVSYEDDRALQLMNRVANLEGVKVEPVPSNFIESGAILQVLWHPDLQDVFTDLMDPDGDEVVLVDASFFCPPGESRNFAQIAEHAQQYGGIAMGIRFPDGSVSLSPDRSHVFEMSDGIKVVAFADAVPA